MIISIKPIKGRKGITIHRAIHSTPNMSTNAMPINPARIVNNRTKNPKTRENVRSAQAWNCTFTGPRTAPASICRKGANKVSSSRVMEKVCATELARFVTSCNWWYMPGPYHQEIMSIIIRCIILDLRKSPT